MFIQYYLRTLPVKVSSLTYSKVLIFKPKMARDKKIAKGNKSPKESRPSKTERAALYKCTECPYSTVDRSNYRVHCRSCSSMGTTYGCHLCERKLRHLSTLKAHLRSFHKCQPGNGRYILEVTDRTTGESVYFFPFFFFPFLFIYLLSIYIL